MKKRNPQRIKDRLWGGIPVRIILPVSLTVILFGLTIFLLLLPLIEKKLMDGKREMIRELTESSWSILAAHAQEERDGLLTRQKAQASAIENLRRLRYGPELPSIKQATDLLIREAMQRANGNQSIAAGMLGISQQALSKRLKKEGVK